MASDSRYTWANKGKFDYGIKVFGSTKHPEIFGFCGDVLFPSMILGQIIPQIDNGILFDELDNYDAKNQKILNYIASSLDAYPKSFLGENFIILHATRFNKEFKLYKTSFRKANGLHNQEIALPKVSSKVFSGGPGSKEFNRNWLDWENKKHNDYRTCRAVYHCLDKTLKSIEDHRTGGLPQIVGLFRIANTRLFGIIENEKK